MKPNCIIHDGPWIFTGGRESVRGWGFGGWMERSTSWGYLDLFGLWLWWKAFGWENSGFSVTKSVRVVIWMCARTRTASHAIRKLQRNAQLQCARTYRDTRPIYVNTLTHRCLVIHHGSEGQASLRILVLLKHRLHRKAITFTFKSGQSWPRFPVNTCHCLPAERHCWPHSQQVFITSAGEGHQKQINKSTKSLPKILVLQSSCGKPLIYCSAPAPDNFYYTSSVTKHFVLQTKGKTRVPQTLKSELICTACRLHLSARSFR